MTTDTDEQALKDAVVKAAEFYDASGRYENSFADTPLRKALNALRAHRTPAPADEPPPARCEPPEWAKGERWHWLEKDGELFVGSWSSNARYPDSALWVVLQQHHLVGEATSKGYVWHSVCSIAKPSPQVMPTFNCGARSGSFEPQDCEWPFCGCDPKANKVIEAIEESGFAIVRAEQKVEPSDEAIRELFRDDTGKWTRSGCITDTPWFPNAVRRALTKFSPPTVEISDQQIIDGWMDIFGGALNRRHAEIIQIVRSLIAKATGQGAE